MNLQGLLGNRNQPGRRVYETKEEQSTDFTALGLKEKLELLSNQIGSSDREQRIRRNTTLYLMALYYHGYQNVDLNPSGDAFDVYEREDFYVENQFRRHVDAVVNMLSKGEGDVIVRPESPSPVDLATARAATPILDMQKATIEYERLRDQKNLYKALFGTAFIYTDYVVDKRYGTVTAPKYDYREVAGPDGEPMLSKVVTGYETRNKGSEIGVVCSPLEVHIRPDIKDFKELPWLRWVSRHDVEILNYVYRRLGLSGGSTAGDDDLSQQYLEVLQNLPGNVLGDSLAFNRGASQVKKAELCRTWIQPCMFRGDKELLRTFPDGVHVVTIDGKIVEYYAENLLDRWTYEVLIPAPASLLGDGLYDALLLQDQINEINSLLIQHMRYSTIGHNIYDEGMLDIKDITNDPKNGWVPARATIDKTITQSVFQLHPGQLSTDVPAWLQAVKTSMQDMTSAYDPSIGKGIGANTPYSQSVFLAERAQSRWQGSLAYNRPELVRFHKNLLQLAKDNWLDDRQRAVMDNVGQWTFQQFSQSDLKGEVDITLSNADMLPRSRPEQVQALQMLQELSALLPMLPPKQKLHVEELLGLPPDSNPMNTQISRAYRHIDRIKNGEVITPLPFVDDPTAQVPVFQDFLASEDGEEIAENDPQTFANIYTFMMHLVALAQGQPTVNQKGQPGQENSQPQKGQHSAALPNQPGGQPGQQGGGSPNPGGQAQSPAPAPPISPPAAGAPSQV